MSDEPTNPAVSRDWRVWAVIAGAVVLLVGGLTAWAVGGNDQSDLEASRDTPFVKMGTVEWPATGSLIDDDDFIAEAAAELDTDTTPILLWAGTGTSGTLDISKYAAFAIPVNSPDTSELLARLAVVGIGDDIDSPYVKYGLAPLKNLVIALPLDEVEGKDHSGVWLVREDVTAASSLEDDETPTIVDRFVGGGGGSGLELETDAGVFYTDPKLESPLPADLWDREVARDVIGKLEWDGPWVTAVGEPSTVEFDEGTGVVAPIAEQNLSDLAHGEDGAIRWSAFIQLPAAMVDSATSPTIHAPAAASTQHRDALADGYPYAVHVDEKRIGAPALVITPGITTRHPRDSGPGLGTLDSIVSSARTDPELPVIAAPSDGSVAQILGFDTTRAAVIWYDEGGEPLWSTVVSAPEEESG